MRPNIIDITRSVPLDSYVGDITYIGTRRTYVTSPCPFDVYLWLGGERVLQLDGTVCRATV